MEHNDALNGQEAEPTENQTSEDKASEAEAVVIEQDMSVQASLDESTPEEVPEEGDVKEDLSDDEASEPASMESLLEEQGVSLDLPTQGEVRVGTIATIRDNEILVSIGSKSEGILSGRELENIPSEDREAFQPGQDIPVYVVAPEDSSGNVVALSFQERTRSDSECSGRRQNRCRRRHPQTHPARR